jgi:hypothetical protein
MIHFEEQQETMCASKMSLVFFLQKMPSKSADHIEINSDGHMQMSPRYPFFC